MKDKIQKAIIKCDETGSDPVYKDEQRKKFFLEAINMMKKVMISAIAMTMAVSMAACGQNTAGSNTASAEDTSAQTTTVSDGSSTSDSGSEQLDGGWETPATPELTDEAKKALEKATMR